jgi:hypothetical protein
VAFGRRTDLFPRAFCDLLQAALQVGIAERLVLMIAQFRFKDPLGAIGERLGARCSRAKDVLLPFVQRLLQGLDFLTGREVVESVTPGGDVAEGTD